MQEPYSDPEQLQRLWEEADKFVRRFYTEELKLDEYMPVVKDGIEYKLNLLQHWINTIVAYDLHFNIEGTTHGYPYAVMLATQQAFWLGYKEGNKSTEQDIELPKGFFDALGE
jgi:hypothetical protein